MRELLGGLYDNAYLSQHRLLPMLVESPSPDPGFRAQQLRSLVIDTVNSLWPAGRPSTGDRKQRACRALAYRYLDGLANADIRKRLAISERQLFRDLSLGVHLLALALSARAGRRPEPSEEALAASLSRVGLRLERLPLQEVCSQALPVAEKLAAKLDKKLLVEDGSTGDSLAVADMALSRQALIVVLAYALRAARSEVLLEQTTGTQTEIITVRFETDPQRLEDSDPEALHLAQQLLEQQGGSLQVSTAGEHVICLHWPKFQSPAILVVEDDPGMLRLFGRYLGGHGYRVIGLSDGSRAVELARENRVRLVILDVMMRGMDGWAVLQRLKASPDTQSVPVLVCSVINEPHLASVLGAEMLLRKPVTGEQLLEAVATIVGI